MVELQQQKTRSGSSHVSPDEESESIIGKDL